MAGFLSGLADSWSKQLDDRRGADAYAPLLEAVYGGQPAPQQSGGFLSQLLGMGQAPQPAGAQVAQAPAQPGAEPGIAPPSPAGMGAPQGGLAQPPSLPGIGGGGQIPREAILGLLSRPETREQGVALLMNGGRMPREKLPNDEAGYLLSRQQGFTGSFLDYKRELAAAGRSSTNVTVNAAAGENEFQKTFGKGQAERYNTMIEQGDQANNMIGDIKALQDIGSRIQTGAGAQTKLLLGPYAQALGIKIDDLPDLQAYQSVVSRLAPQMRVPGSGANSDFEARQFLLSLPTLGNTPGGNKLIEDTLLGIAQNKRAAADIARQAGTGQITRQQADQMLQALPDPFTAFRQSGAATTPPPAGAPAQGTPDADGWVTLPNGVRVRQKGQ
ncbi:MAG: hypothetical protein ABFE07_24205 [Armatimonadia bacterium]